VGRFSPPGPGAERPDGERCAKGAGITPLVIGWRTPRPAFFQGGMGPGVPLSGSASGEAGLLTLRVGMSKELAVEALRPGSAEFCLPRS